MVWNRMWLGSVAATLLTLAPVVAQEKASDIKPTLPESWVNSSIEWRSIGPANMSGRIPSMAVYEKDPSTWWAASASGGLLKTTNNGVTFEHQFDKEATVSIGDVQVYQKDPNILYVGTGEANPRNSVSWGDGVYKSIDGGKTWKNVGLKKTFQIGRMAIHPENPDVVYVGAMGRLWGPSEDRGLYKTTDGGKTWKKILYVDDKTGVIDLQMDPKNPDTLFVATYERKRDGFDGNDPEVKFGSGAGIYRTTDGGESFTKLSEGLPTVKMGRIGLSIYRKDPSHIYAVIETEKIGQAPPNMAYAGLTGQDAEVGAKLTRITNDGPSDKAGLKVDDIVVAIDGKIITSYEDLLKKIRASKVGDTVKLTVSRERKTEELELTFGKRPQNTRSRSPRGSSGQAPFAQSLGGQNPNLQDQQGEDGHEYGGIYLSKDGGDSWERINSLNPRPMYYSQIRVDPSDNNYIWVLGTSLYKSKDGGKTFTDDGHGRDVHVDHHSMWIDPTDGRHVILGNDGGIYVTWDRGKNWDHHNHVAIGQFYHVGIGPNKDYHVYGGLQDNGSWGGPARIRNDSGSTNNDWYRVGSGDGFIVLVDPKDKDQIYFESQNGAMGRIHLATGERGFIRPRAPRGTRYRFNWKTPFILSPHNSKIHYSAGNHVFRSVYKGDGIKAISPEITNTDKGAGSAISESAAEEGVIYAGTTDGALWVTTDGGNQWVDLFKNPNDVKAPASAPAGGRGRGGAARGSRGGGAASGRPTRPGGGPPAGRPGAGEGRPDGPPPGAGRPGGGNRANFMARVIERVKASDANKDGKIEKDELPDRMKPLFDRMDKNKDGKLTEDELKPPTSGDDPMVFTSMPLQEEEAQEAKPEEKKEGEETQEEKKEEAKSDEKKTDEAKPEEAAAKVEDIVSGTWDAKFITDRMPEERRNFKLIMRLAKDGKKLTGEMVGGMAGGGDIEGTYNAKSKAIEFRVDTGRFDIDIAGTVSGKSLQGDIDINGGSFSMEYEATRTGDAPAPGKTADESKPADDASKPIKELVPGPRWVSSISASKFAKGRCYITLDGHRSNDDEPYVFATENYGKTWRSIRANLPTMAGSTRVVREDIENQDILYLGCEFSTWVSVDRGKSWTKFNNNLPTVAVHELAQHPTTGDIVAGTHGRSLWIANVTALRQMNSKVMAADAHLFKPNEVIRWRSFARRGSTGTRSFMADNASSQAAIHYKLGKNANDVKIRISDIKGETVYEAEGEKTAGLHAMNWNLSRQRSANAGGRGGRGGRGGFRGGRTVGSGTYLVTLMVDGNEMKEELTVTTDPTYGDTATTDEEYELMKLFYGASEDEEGDIIEFDDN